MPPFLDKANATVNYHPQLASVQSLFGERYRVCRIRPSKKAEILLVNILRTDKPRNGYGSHSALSHEHMKVSVIIPTYKRPQTLLQTLQSLQKQTLTDFEILVMDNAVEPAIEHMITEFNQTAQVPVRYIGHAAGGNSGARNRGAKEAKGDLLIYTDDDLTFVTNWVEAYVTQFREHPEMLVAGGCVKPAWETQPPSWLIGYIGDQKAFPILALLEWTSEFALVTGGWLYSCNMAIRRSVFEWTGFHPEMYGTQTIGDGEAGLVDDIYQRGGLRGHVPEATAYHHIPAHRMTVQYIRRWAWHRGGSDMYKRWRGRKRSISALGRAAIGIVRRYWRFWIKDRLVRHRRDGKAIDMQFTASLGWCELSYVWWMVADQKVRTALDMRDFRPGKEPFAAP